MIDSPAFEFLDELLGCRTDDPRLIELHRTHELAPPPLFSERTDWSGDGTDTWSFGFQATVRVPGSYPSPRVNGTGPVVGFVNKVYFQDGYEGTIRDGLTTALPEPEARAMALESSVEEYGNLVHILHRDERSTLEVRYHGDGRFIWYQLMLNELAEDDPALRPATPAGRAIPSLPEPDPDEPYPPALQALYDYQGTTGFGELSFEVYNHFKLASGMRDSEAEREFRVFGSDDGGGEVAFWLVHDGHPVVEQPIVFMESEGTVGPVAVDLCDFIHLLAAGYGPYEAVMYGVSEDPDPRPGVTEIADTHLTRRETRTADAIVDAAEAQYSDIHDRIDALTTTSATSPS